MKTLNNFINEVRRKVNYGQDSTMICTEEELDKLSDIIRAGAKALNFDLEAKENEFSLTVGFLDTIETLGSHSDEDKVEIKLFKKDKKEE